MSRIAVLALLASGCLISPVMTFGGQSSKQAQHATLSRVTPPILDTDATWTGEVRAVPIRVWADDDYRAQNVHWEKTFQEQLDYANAVLASQFGVRLEPAFRVWHRHATEATLDDSLAELATEDPGDGVLTVIGLTSAAGLASATFEQLGVANLQGHHLVIRGYADADERKTFERVFPDLEPGERDALYQARRHHKGASIVLHELGHNLGAIHQSDGNTLMSPTYSVHAAGFDDASHATILAVLDDRLHRAHTSTTSPAAPTPATDDGHTSLVVVVDPTGAHRVGGAALDDATLDGLLALSYGDDPETAIVVRPQPGAPPSAVQMVVEHAKAAGLRRVSVVAAD